MWKVWISKSNILNPNREDYNTGMGKHYIGPVGQFKRLPASLVSWGQDPASCIRWGQDPATWKQGRCSAGQQGKNKTLSAGWLSRCSVYPPPSHTDIKHKTAMSLRQTLNCQIWVDLRRSSGLRRVRGTSLSGCRAMSLMSSTYVTDELNFSEAALDDMDLWGSCGADEPSCCSIPVLDIRHNCERFPGSCAHHSTLKTARCMCNKIHDWRLTALHSSKKVALM